MTTNEDIHGTGHGTRCANESHAGSRSGACTESRTGSHVRSRRKSHAISRGLALFFGLFSLANAVGYVVGKAAVQSVWWIGFHIPFIPNVAADVAATVLQILCGLSLVAWAFKPNTRLTCRFAAISAVVLAAFALENAVGFWASLASGGVHSAIPVPTTLAIAACMAAVAVTSCRCASTGGRGAVSRGIVPTIAVALVAALVFPLAQTALYGTADYRAHGDVIVSFGAKVREDGSMSLSLEERVKSAAKLYLDGYAEYLMVSGGQGPDEPVNEANAMRDYAISLGVPASAIIVDLHGDTTEATVENSLEVARERGFSTILADSSFYHLPRIEMLYLEKLASEPASSQKTSGSVESGNASATSSDAQVEAGAIEVRTVPAEGSFTPGSAKALFREIPAWWYYWARCCIGTI